MELFLGLINGSATSGFFFLIGLSVDVVFAFLVESRSLKSDKRQNQ